MSFCVYGKVGCKGEGGFVAWSSGKKIKMAKSHHHETKCPYVRKRNRGLHTILTTNPHSH